jgi:aminopeptidase N
MIDYFDREFPFPKNDFVLLPGFAFRAMEHAGATFFREDALLFRRQPTRIDRLNRSVLILHELSHQWFGNLVTMRWFDDLWLKEGFANYIAFVALAADEGEQPEFVWKRFYQNFKPDALEVDITGGTTPLRQKLANLKDAKTAYGAIVYTKAPTVLRNLEFVLGEKDFRGGVQIFLKRHAYGNADWTDFVRAFEEFSGESLRRWANDYIVRRGTTFVKPRWSCDARNKIADLNVSQTDALGETGAQRAIKAQILLAYDDAPPKIIPYHLETKRKTIREAVGKKCPAYVFANYGDHGYAYFLLDERSRKAIATGVSETADPFLRSTLWGALWEAVRAAEMPPLDFVRIALRALPGEQDEDLARNLLEYAARAYQSYLTGAQQKTVIVEFENLCRREMREEAVEVGRRINYWRTFYSIAETPDARAFLKKLLSGETKIPASNCAPPTAGASWLICSPTATNKLN